MHPTYGTGDPPAAFRREPQPSRQSRPVRQPESPRAEALRRKIRRIDRRLVVVNAACFLAVVVLSAAVPGVLGTSVVGQLNLGLLLCIGLGVLTLFTSVAYDRRLARDCDPEAEAIRLSAEGRAAAAESASAWTPQQSQGQPFQSFESFQPSPFQSGQFQTRPSQQPQQWGAQHARTQQWGPGQERSDW